MLQNHTLEDLNNVRKRCFLIIAIILACLAFVEFLVHVFHSPPPILAELRDPDSAVRKMFLKFWPGKDPKRDFDEVLAKELALWHVHLQKDGNLHDPLRHYFHLIVMLEYAILKADKIPLTESLPFVKKLRDDTFSLPIADHRGFLFVRFAEYYLPSVGNQCRRLLKVLQQGEKR